MRTRSPRSPTVFSSTGIDYFSFSSLDTCFHWAPAVRQHGCTNYGDGETGWYLPSQVSTSHGVLILTATRTPTLGYSATGKRKTYAYRTGMVTTYNSRTFTYGTVSVSAKIPGGAGTWPAVWLLPKSGSWPPEVDVMENWGASRVESTTYIWGRAVAPQKVAQKNTSSTDLTSSYHTYGLVWAPGSLTWTLDGRTVFKFTGKDVPHTPMYLLVALAIDGSAPSPSTMSVRSITVSGSSV